MQGSKGVTVSGFTALTLVFMVSAAQAAPITSTWVGNGGTDFRWGRSGNWDNGRPDNGDGDNYTAVIDNGETVQLDKEVEIDVLNLGQTNASGLVIENNQSLGLLSGTSTVGTGSTLQIEQNGLLDNQAGSTIENAGSIDNDGILTNGGTIENTGDINLNAGSTLDNTGGTISNNTGGVINANELLTFGDAATGTIALNSGGTLNVGSTTVTNSEFDSLGNDNTLTNGGTLNVNGTFQNDGTLDNTGALNVNTGGTLNNAETLNNTGTLTLNAGSTLDYTGGRLNNNDGGEIILNTDLQIFGINELDDDYRFGLKDNSTLTVNSGNTLTIGHTIGTPSVGGDVLQSFGDITGGGDIIVGGGGVNLGNVLNMWGDSKLDLSNGTGPDGTLLVEGTAGVGFVNTAQLAGGLVQNNNLILFDQDASMTGGTVTNAGQLTLSDTATISGGTVTNDGVVTFNSGTSMTGGTINNNATLNMDGVSVTGGIINENSGNTLTVTNSVISGTTTQINVSADATANFTDSSLQGGTIKNSGTVSITETPGATNASIAGGKVINDGTMSMNGSARMSSGTVTNNSGGVVDINGTLTNAGLIDNQGTMNNDGTMNNAGILNFDTGSTFDNTGGILNNEDGGEINLGIDLTLGSTEAGTINLKTGSILNNSANLDLTNGTNISTGTINNEYSGTLTVNDTSQVSGGTVTNNGTMSLNNNAQMSEGMVTNDEYMWLYDSSTISGDAEVTNNDSMWLYDSSTISGDAEVTNNDSMLLYDSSTISGGTVTNDSFLTLKDSAQISGGTVTNDGTTSFYLGASMTSGTVTNNSFMQLSHWSSIAGGTVTNNGDMRLYLSSSISGGTVTNNGDMKLDNSSSISGGTVTNNSGGVIQRFQYGTSIIGGTLINQGLVKGDGGDSFFGYADGLFLTGDVSGAGRYEGSITFNGTLEKHSTFSPGNSPALIDAETLIFGEFNDLFMEIGGTVRGTEYDAFNISGAVTFGGLLNLSFINSFLPSGPSTFDLFNFGSASGTFANIVLPTLDNMWLWNTDSLYTDGSISIVAAVIDTGVPGPGAVLILVVGLAGFAGLRRRND